MTVWWFQFTCYQINNLDISWIYQSLSVSLYHSRQTALGVRAAPVMKCPIEFAEVDLSPTTSLLTSHSFPDSRQSWAQRDLSLLGSIPHLNCTSSSIAGRVLHDAQGNDLVCEEWKADGAGDDVEDILMPLLKILLILSCRQRHFH